MRGGLDLRPVAAEIACGIYIIQQLVRRHSVVNRAPFDRRCGRQMNDAPITALEALPVLKPLLESVPALRDFEDDRATCELRAATERQPC
jgi:hypothetical protein